MIGRTHVGWGPWVEAKEKKEKRGRERRAFTRHHPGATMFGMRRRRKEEKGIPVACSRAQRYAMEKRREKKEKTPAETGDGESSHNDGEKKKGTDRAFFPCSPTATSGKKGRGGGENIFRTDRKSYLRSAAGQKREGGGGGKEISPTAQRV